MRHYLVIAPGDDVEISWQYAPVIENGHVKKWTPTTKTVHTAPPADVAEARDQIVETAT